MSWINSTYYRLRDHPRQTLTLMFALCVVVYLVTIPLPRVDGMLIGSDGGGYYMYVRSLVLDRDLNFANEYTQLRPRIDLTEKTTRTGMISNQYGIGTGILWAPFFILAHLIVLGLRGVGVPIIADGYGYIYQAAVCLGSIVYGFLGILLIFQTMRRLVSSTALAASLLIWLASNFIYYQIIEPSMSHMCSLFAVALLIYVWIRSRPVIHLRDCLVIGVAGGLVGIVRQPDVTLLILPILDCLLYHDEPLLKVKRVATILVGFFLIFWVQMAVWLVLYGNPFVSGYLFDGQQGFSWLSPHLIEVLFSTEHGLFLWHPILLFAAIGLAIFSQRDRKLSVLFIGGILLQAYIIASWSSWSQADSFGGRMFIASLPIFAIGLGAILQWASEKKVSRAIWAIGIILVFWNALFLIQYRTGFISMNGPYTLRQLTIGKVEMLVELGKIIAPLISK